jgi:hypothetical protein
VSDNFTVRSITVTEVIGTHGERQLTIDVEGDPSQWDVLGMLDYAQAAERGNAAWPEDEE